ncbi:hypothetical protein GDO81_027793 [Engystomops pustulosus]|uniref:Taste receptor type 2 member 40 n=1 Tax=Engystomops pustulosus TaxID=76066 RepID=A0AAV6ZLN5_ENGPU|nr:hypothetical protein GDO81_027793 [Engystomops pustulosus]
MLILTLSTSWLTAWLCLYFFVKIIYFKSSFLGKLKLTIDAAVPWLIVISEVVAFSTSLPVIWTLTKPLTYNSTSCNDTCPVSLSQINSVYYSFALGFSSNSALLIVLVSTVCIVWSLYRHTYRMKKTMSSDDHSHIRTHRRAARTVASLLLIYIVYYGTYVLISTLFHTNNFSVYFWLTVWVSLSTSPAMSLVLIHGNTKLSMALHQIVFCSPSLP